MKWYVPKTSLTEKPATLPITLILRVNFSIVLDFQTKTKTTKQKLPTGGKKTFVINL